MKLSYKFTIIVMVVLPLAITCLKLVDAKQPRIPLGKVSTDQLLLIKGGGESSVGCDPGSPNTVNCRTALTVSPLCTHSAEQSGLIGNEYTGNHLRRTNFPQAYNTKASTEGKVICSKRREYKPTISEPYWYIIGWGYTCKTNHSGCEWKFNGNSANCTVYSLSGQYVGSPNYESEFYCGPDP